MGGAAPHRNVNRKRIYSLESGTGDSGSREGLGSPDNVEPLDYLGGVDLP
jgi:hypothetical protein